MTRSLLKRDACLRGSIEGRDFGAHRWTFRERAMPFAHVIRDVRVRWRSNGCRVEHGDRMAASGVRETLGTRRR